MLSRCIQLIAKGNVNDGRNMSKVLFSSFFTISLLLAATLPGYAQATRTWVSGVGDDVNPCSRTAPCKTFAGAISKTADGGEIDVLDPGGFGTVTITKSITIDGGGGSLASVLNSGTNGINVNAAGITVTLRNLSINGAGTTKGLVGINVLKPANLHIENVQVFNQSQFGLRIQPEGTGSSTLKVVNSIFRENGGNILLSPGSSTLTGTFSSVAANRGTYGLRLESNAFVTVQRGSFSNNTNNGVIAVGTSTVNVEDSMSTNNGTNGFVTVGGATISLARTGVFNNATGLNSSAGGNIISFGSNQILGNATAGSPTSTMANQ